MNSKNLIRGIYETYVYAEGKDRIMESGCTRVLGENHAT